MAATTDLSRQLLDRIFGANWDTYVSGGTVTDTGTILGKMFEVANLLMLGISVFIVVYFFVSATITASHEGKVSGRRGGGPWTPIRLIFAIGASMPVFKGFSVIQGLILFFAGTGIYGANQIWAGAIDWVKDRGIFMAAPAQPPTDAARQVLDSLICMHYLNGDGVTDFAQGGAVSPMVTQRMINRVRYAPLQTKNRPRVPRAREIGLQWNGTAGSSLPDKVCGSVIITCKDGPKIPSTTKQVCSDKIDAFIQLTSDLDPIASAIASRTDNNSISGGGAIQNAINRYINTITASISTVISSGNVAAKKVTKDFADAAKQSGWLGIGWWYLDLARLNQSTSEVISDGFGYTPILGDRITKGQKVELALRVVAARDYYINYSEGANGGAGDSLENEGAAEFSNFDPVAWLSDKLSAPFIAGTKWIGTTLTTGDPIIAISTSGQTMIGIAWTAYTALGVAAYSAGTGQAIAFGLGDAVTGAPSGVAGALSLLTPLLTMFLGALLFAGYSLAYYIPALPWILWTLAAVGWLVLLVELLIAAPIWMLATAIPEGDGLAGQHGRQGWLTFLAVILRPGLMVLGFMFGVLVLNVGTWLTGIGFEKLVDGLATGNLFGFGAATATIIILFTVLLKMVHVCFGFLYSVPNAVFAMIGAHNTGDKISEAGVREIKGAIGILGTRVESVMGRGSSPMGSAGKPPGGGGATPAGKRRGTPPASITPGDG